MSKKSRTRSNGHAKPNGADVASSVRGQAASVDADGRSVARASGQFAEVTAGHEAYAEAAHAPNGKANGAPPRTARASGETPAPSEHASPWKDEPEKIPGATKPLPRDGEDFVRAVHRQTDLVALETKLLNSKDEKVAQRELACLRELRYGKTAPAADDDQRPMLYDAPRPERE